MLSQAAGDKCGALPESRRSSRFSIARLSSGFNAAKERMSESALGSSLGLERLELEKREVYQKSLCPDLPNP